MKLRNLLNKDVDNILEWMKDEDIVQFFRFETSEINENVVLNFISEAHSNKNSYHFAIVNEYDDKEVKNLILQDQSVVDNFDIDLITSFDMSLDDNQEYQIDPATVSIDSFSKKRSEFLSSCSRTRSKNKEKIKSKLSRDISRLQKEILENEKSMLSDDYDYF